jgi:hypothetical protein
MAKYINFNFAPGELKSSRATIPFFCMPTPGIFAKYGNNYLTLQIFIFVVLALPSPAKKERGGRSFFRKLRTFSGPIGQVIAFLPNKRK